MQHHDPVHYSSTWLAAGAIYVCTGPGAKYGSPGSHMKLFERPTVAVQLVQPYSVLPAQHA